MTISLGLGLGIVFAPAIIPVIVPCLDLVPEDLQKVCRRARST